MADIAIRLLKGDAAAAGLADLARLRIAVFAEWPYLYAGDLAYEEQYLRDFASAPHAVIVAAMDGATIIGAATASPMAGQAPAISDPFTSRDMNISRLFYFGESVLLPQYRGLGIGHRFFDAREEHARLCGATTTCFAAVIRPADHPARPAGYAPLDPFWRKRGYTPQAGLVASMDWQEHGEAGETPHDMQFWGRVL